MPAPGAVRLAPVAFALLGAQLLATGAVAQDRGVIEGRAVDSARGEPAADLALGLYRPVVPVDRVFPEPWVPESLGAAEEAVERLHAGPDGSFRFDGLPMGRYVVKPLGPLAEHRYEVVLAEDAPRAVVLLEVRMGGVLAGRVVDERGAPLAGHFAFVAGVDRGDGLNATAGRVSASYARADEAGRFEIVRVPEGRVHVQAGLADWGWSAPRTVDVDGATRRRDLLLVVPDEREQLAPAGAEIGGIGVELQFSDQGPRVARVFAGMPAEAAGLRDGDVLAAVDGRPTRFMIGTEFRNRCRGPVGSTVRLRVVRAGGAPFDVDVVRAPILRERR